VHPHQKIPVRLQGLIGAVRFALIPMACALLVAVASEHPRGRTIALILAILSVIFGAVVHGREILLGRPLPSSGAAPPYSEDEWMRLLR
jgi:disulfide bond formation protein DsbB